MERIENGPVVIDLSAAVVRGPGGVVATLTPVEVTLLRFGLEHEGKALSKADLLTQVWGYRPGAHARALDSTVYRLRRKVELDPGDPKLIQTAFGIGYRFCLPRSLAGARDREGRDAGEVDLVATLSDDIAVSIRCGSDRRCTIALDALAGGPWTGIVSVDLRLCASDRHRRLRWAMALGLQRGMSPTHLRT